MINITKIEKLDNEFKKSSGIYMLYSKNTGGIYIGSSSNLYKRYGEHRRAILKKKHYNYKIKKIIYNFENDLYFQIWELCSKNKLIEKEQIYLDLLINKKISLNIRKIADSCLGVKRTEEFKQKQRKLKKGIKHSKETKQKISKNTQKEKNPNYIDGRTYTQYYCINCKKKIYWSTWIHGSKMCYKCYRKHTKIWNKRIKLLN